MKLQFDPLDMVRQSRIKMSHDVDNDPLKMITRLRKQEIKYSHQIEQYKMLFEKVAEEPTKYGKN